MAAALAWTAASVRQIIPALRGLASAIRQRVRPRGPVADRYQMGVEVLSPAEPAVLGSIVVEVDLGSVEMNRAAPRVALNWVRNAGLRVMGAGWSSTAEPAGCRLSAAGLGRPISVAVARRPVPNLARIAESFVNPVARSWIAVIAQLLRPAVAADKRMCAVALRRPAINWG